MLNEQADAYESLLQFLYRAPIGLMQTTLAGDIEMINPMAAQLLMPLSPDGSLNNLFAALKTLAPQLPELVNAPCDSAGMLCDALRLQADGAQAGRPRRQTLALSLIKIGDNRLMASLNDVSLEVAREQQGLALRLRDAARIDTLTNMPNRAALCEQVSEALARAAVDPRYQFAVICLNCDRFKQINHTLGQAAGDALLGLIAERFRATSRQSDQIGRSLLDQAGAAADPAATCERAACVGGDEFVVLIDALRSPEDIHAVAKRLLDALSLPYELGGKPVSCSVSMGIVLRAQAAGDADTVIQDASIAMIDAKRAGGGRYILFDPAMRERAALRGSIEADLRRALVEDQLYVVYQPVVGLQGADAPCYTVGVEALVRWRHPTRGVVPPLAFIGVAEECGLIDAIGQFVLERACRDFVAWQAALGSNAPSTMAVNLSRAQLANPGLIDTVRSILQSSGMPPTQLQLEITESLAAQDEQIQQRLRELKLLQLTLALDDFGTGYSSLASLHLLPVDTVKIDRSFVSQVSTSHYHRVLIEATVNVAKSLGMATVAEGIETQDQARMVTALGCDKGQGYLFSKPLPAEELLVWLVAHAPPALKLKAP
jgi:predicted signal transduction protein with EAL and GGDEF domain